MTLPTPLHPLLVHFPIALLILGGAVQILALWKREPFEKIATFLLVIGFISGLVTYFTGDSGVRFARQYLTSNVRSMVRPHETFAQLSLFTFALLLLVKFVPKLRLSKIFIPAIVILSLTGATLVGITGHYGGKIVYDTSSASNRQVQNKAAPIQPNDSSHNASGSQTPVQN